MAYGDYEWIYDKQMLETMLFTSLLHNEIKTTRKYEQHPFSVVNVSLNAYSKSWQALCVHSCNQSELTFLRLSLNCFSLSGQIFNFLCSKCVNIWWKIKAQNSDFCANDAHQLKASNTFPAVSIQWMPTE